jgi:hypothetical protein
MRQLGALDTGQYFHIIRHTPQRLVGQAEQRLQCARTGSGRMQPQLLVSTSDKHIIALTSAESFTGNDVFQPRGYSLLASDAGRTYADSITPRYERLIPGLTRDAFRGQWASHIRQMGGLNAKHEG